MEEYNRDILDWLLHAVPRVYRDRTSPFETLSDTEFRKRYRFSRRAFFSIVDVMDDDLHRRTRRSCALNTAQQLAIVIRVLTSNAFQIHASDTFGVDQSTVSRVVRDVSDWFSANSNKFVQWHTDGSRARMQRRVREKTGLPDIVGAIDGTHVKIIAPHDREWQYVNRKDYHSINVGAIVDNEYRFLWFSARWPGRSHDSRVFRESDIHRKFVSGELQGRLVGDSAYRTEPFLLKVFSGHNLDGRQRSYNRAICKFRSCVEQSFGQLKRQFHAMHATLRYSPERASKLIATAICLRNCAVDLMEPDFGDDEVEEFEDYDSDVEEDGQSEDNRSSGRRTMEEIARKYF